MADTNSSLASLLRGYADAARTTYSREVFMEAARRIERLDEIQSDEVMYALRRTDGEPMAGDYTFMVAKGPDDWTSAEIEWECGGRVEDHDPIEIEMVRMHVRSVERRLPPPVVEHDCFACWSADKGSERPPRFICSNCRSDRCPRTNSHLNRCDMETPDV